jgi:predicted nucleic acid-binding protein
MMPYLDTSALVKLYVGEAMSNEVAAAVDEAEAVATSLLAYAETWAAFTRARREARLSSQAYRHVVDPFVEDWSRFVVVEVTDQLVREAGSLRPSAHCGGMMRCILPRLCVCATGCLSR